ncbi:MAG: T9SS type A sorting domain-containing protein [Bacteroidetes bacterium]|nr:T9SS type A sorting domain-containing protein [Bacteroidota bacterium]
MFPIGRSGFFLSSFLYPELEIFPNPANQVLYINGIQLSDIQTIEILDVNGKSVSLMSRQLEIKLPLTMPAGTYLLKIVTKENDSHFFKFIKLR